MVTENNFALFGRAGKNGGGWGEEIFAREPSAPPPVRIVEGRDPQKNVLILLEEKIGRAQIRKAENIFLRGTRAERAAAGRFSPRPDVRQSRFGF